MNKLFSQLSLGTLGFAGVAQASQDSIQHAADFINQNTPALENPNTYLKGLIVSGIIQIAMKLIDRYFEKRRARKEAKSANI